MPELPEVNAVAQLLNQTVVDDEIADIQIYCEKLRYLLPTKQEFSAIINKKIRAVTRAGKIILFDCGGDQYLLAHLGMTGAFVLRAGNDEAQTKLKHEHVKLSLSSGRCLSFVDPRKFGYLIIDTKPEQLAPEPVKEQLSKVYLSKLCQATGRPIKLLILDQKNIAGLGNIYANEALFVAGIHPSRPALSLSKIEISRLHKAILKTIEKAMTKGLNRIRQRPLVDTETIHFPINPMVYGEDGQACKKCKALIKKIMLSGRGTFFCPYCQKL